MIHAFMEGRNSAAKGKTVFDNPYTHRALMGDPFQANLWESGFMHWLEEASKEALAIQLEGMRHVG